jgi:hypothetical protein
VDATCRHSTRREKIQDDDGPSSNKHFEQGVGSEDVMESRHGKSTCVEEVCLKRKSFTNSYTGPKLSEK